MSQHFQYFIDFVIYLSILSSLSIGPKVADARRDSTYFNNLRNQLSPGASIDLPDSPNFKNATTMWSGHDAPQFSAVVHVASPQDVAKTVEFSTLHGVPFLAINHKHGASSTFSKFQDGIQIDISGLDSVEISDDGEFVRLGGGVYTDQVIRYLYSRGKMSATGSCGCVGLMGASLGGGHGITQGLFGLMLDNYIGMTVVLANASVVTASNSENPDLFWALRGAGHNFGIVTEVTYRIHDAVPADGHWYIETLSFTQDKLEQVYEAYNELITADIPPELTIFGRVVVNPVINTEEPSVVIEIDYAGSLEDAAIFVAPFHSLGPASLTVNASTPYEDVALARNLDPNSATCAFGGRHDSFPIGLSTINTTALRLAYNYLNDTITAHPGLRGTGLVFEGYSNRAVQSIPSDSTAFPHRGDRLIAAAGVSYTNSSLDELVPTVGNNLRQIMLDGSGHTELHAYVNYAYGTERLEEIYGYEPWRLEKLRALKAEFDGNEIFSYYHPIPPA